MEIRLGTWGAGDYPADAALSDGVVLKRYGSLAPVGDCPCCGISNARDSTARPAVVPLAAG